MGKRRAKNDKDIAVSISPWTDKKDGGEVSFSVVMLQVKEMIYGEIPGGRVELLHTGKGDARKYIKEQETATISISDEKADKEYPGFTYEFNVFITNRQYQNNQITLDFVCIPGDDLVRGKNFYTALYSETYPSIWDAIDASYPGPIDKRCETNVPDTVSVYRDNETSYDFVKRLGFSWKNRGVFAFGWEGLLLKEIVGINSFGVSEEDEEKIQHIKGDQNDWSQVSYHKLKYNKNQNMKFFNVWEDPNKDSDENLIKSVTPDDWYKEIEPKHVTSSIAGQDYKIHRKDYSVMHENRSGNETFSSCGGYSSITLVGDDMPRRWKLGDIILYERNRNDDSDSAGEEGEGNVKPAKFLVVSNEMFFSQNGSSRRGPHRKIFEWTTILWSVEKKENYSEELEKNTENES